MSLKISRMKTTDSDTTSNRHSATSFVWQALEKSMPTAHVLLASHVPWIFYEAIMSFQVDVEPVTGRIWQRRIQLQLHAGLRACDVNGHRLRPLNLTYLDKAVPIVSTDRRAILSGAELSFYNYKVSFPAVTCRNDFLFFGFVYE